MKYTVTLQDNRKIDVHAQSISRAAVLATWLFTNTNDVSIVVQKPSNLLDWWTGRVGKQEVTFKIKPTDWSRN